MIAHSKLGMCGGMSVDVFHCLLRRQRVANGRHRWHLTREPCCVGDHVQIPESRVCDDGEHVMKFADGVESVALLLRDLRRVHQHKIKKGGVRTEEVKSADHVCEVT